MTISEAPTTRLEDPSAEDVGRATDRALERKANIFAADLLIPGAAARDTSIDPSAALRFGVSKWPCAGAATALVSSRNRWHDQGEG
jgi:Zn-dependent peptidase ImmA (M78 family)